MKGGAYCPLARQVVTILKQLQLITGDGPLLFPCTERNVAAFSERAQDRFGDAKRWPELHANLPFKRAAETSEAGDLVAFITSSRASYLSGQVISLDGGYVASSLPTLASGALAHE